jgi:hypothetical protein
MPRIVIHTICERYKIDEEKLQIDWDVWHKESQGRDAPTDSEILEIFSRYFGSEHGDEIFELIDSDDGDELFGQTGE